MIHADLMDDAQKAFNQALQAQRDACSKEDKTRADAEMVKARELYLKAYKAKWKKEQAEAAGAA